MCLYQQKNSKLKRLMGLQASSRQVCVRVDIQKEGVDFFEYYSILVSWSMISILLALVLQEGWFTRQVDCDNAFSQAELKETVLVKPPKCFAPKSGKYLYLKLLESLYGLKQAPRTFFEN